MLNNAEMRCFWLQSLMGLLSDSPKPKTALQVFYILEALLHPRQQVSESLQLKVMDTKFQDTLLQNHEVVQSLLSFVFRFTVETPKTDLEFVAARTMKTFQRCLPASQEETTMGKPICRFLVSRSATER